MAECEWIFSLCSQDNPLHGCIGLIPFDQELLAKKQLRSSSVTSGESA